MSQPRFTVKPHANGYAASIYRDGKRWTGSYSIGTARRYCAWLNAGCPTTPNRR